MKREILYTMKMPYRQDFLLEGFRFGEGEKSCAVVGGIRGDEVQQMYNKLYRPDLVNNKAVQTNAVVDTAKLLHAKYIADMGDKTALSSIIGDSNNRIASIAQKIIDSMQETVSQGKELGIENQIINTLAQSSHDDRSFISNKSLESCIAEAESQKREMSTHDSHLENNKNGQESLFMEH